MFKKYYLLVSIIFWIAFSFVLAKSLALNEFPKTFETDSILVVSNSEIVSNIFVAWFTILAGIGSILIAMYIREKDLDIHNFALLEPVTIQDVVLNDIDIDLKFNKDSEKDDYIGCSFLIERGSRIFEFIFIEYLQGFFKLVHNSLSMRKDQCIFALVNNGKAQALPTKYTLLYKKIPSDNGGKDRYSNREDCCICESLKNYSYFSPKNDYVKILWIYGGKLYENFFKERPIEFIVVIEYTSVPTKRKIMQAYKSVIRKKMVKDKEMNFLMEFNAMTKSGIDDMIEKTFAKKIKKYAIFD